MNDTIKIGTFLYHRRFQLAGKVIDIENPHSKNRMYDMYEDDRYFWLSEECDIITEKEYLVYRLKNTDRADIYREEE